MSKSKIYFFDSYEMLNRFKKQCDNTFVCCIGRSETENAISKGLDIITTDLTSLTTDLLVNGYQVFVHKKDWGNPNEKCEEIMLGNTPSTDKEIRMGHNLQRLFIGGCFG